MTVLVKTDGGKVLHPVNSFRVTTKNGFAVKALRCQNGPINVKAASPREIKTMPMCHRCEEAVALDDAENWDVGP